MRTCLSHCRWMIALVAMSALALTIACGEGPETPSFNACDLQGELTYDGEAAQPGDSCGSVCGVLACDEEGLFCDDPELNACGGCAELSGEPESSCDPSEGETGIWECDGEEAVTCVSTDTNLCGGTQALDTDPDVRCGACGLDTYQCVGINDTECIPQIGCPEARDLAATQGVHGDRVVVTWRGSIYASGYKVYRDGTEIAELSAAALSYSDTGADPSGAPAGVDVTASTDDTEGIEVDWMAEPADGAQHDYQVEVLFDDGESSELSDPVVGYRGADIERYELSIDGGAWLNMEEQTQFFDTDAPRATVAPQPPVVIDSDWDWIELSATSPDITDAQQRDYSVRAVTADGTESDTGEATGQRAHEDELDYVWSASVDSMDDADFSNLDDCADQLTCIDDDFDDETAEKYYRFGVHGVGVETTHSDPLVAGVDLLMVEPDVTQVEYSVGESADFGAQIVTPDGQPLAREGVELEVDVSGAATVDDPFQTVITDENGWAEVTVTFATAGSDVVNLWSAVDDVRVSDVEVEQGPYDVVLMGGGDDDNGGDENGED